MTEKNKVDLGGTRPLDLAFMIRNWGWYEIISLDSGMTQQEIDLHLLGEKTAVEKSAFGEMKRHCRSPDKRFRKGTSKDNGPYLSAFQLVHAEGRYDYARRWYESNLWETLSARNLTEGDHEAVIQQRINLFNKEHGTSNDKAILLSSLAIADGFHLASEAQPEPSPAESVKFAADGYFFDEMRPIEELEMYSALYRLKISSPGGTRSLIHAWIKKAFNKLILAKPFTEHENHAISRCLRLLIEDRIVLNQWWTKSSFLAYEKEEREKNPKKKNELPILDRYAAWYIAKSIPFGAPALLDKLK